MTNTELPEKTATENFIKDLRTKTEKSHRALEENDLSKRLLSELITPADYTRYLVKMYGLVKGSEIDIYPQVSEIFPDAEARKRSQMIEADLAAMGMNSADQKNIPIKKYAPANIAAAAGMMYVLEGSTLGGKMIYKHVNKYLDVDAKHGGVFFYGYGENTGTMWKNFLQQLSKYAVTYNAGDKIAAAAVETFDDLKDWLV